MSERVLIVGSGGQLAGDLKLALGLDFDISLATRTDFDVRDYFGCEDFIKKCRPGIVINTTAFHNTRECEKNPQLAFEVNALGALHCARAARVINARSVYISTDYVFDGQKQFYSEDDLPGPLNVYGASKLVGEYLTVLANSQSYVIRTSWLYGDFKSGKGHNFVSLMLEKAKINVPVRVVNDQFGSPTYTKDLALKMRDLLQIKPEFGIYHLTNANFGSWYDFAKAIFDFSNRVVDLESISTEQSGDTIRRPKQAILMNNRDIGQMRDWRRALQDYLQRYQSLK